MLKTPPTFPAAISGPKGPTHKKNPYPNPAYGTTWQPPIDRIPGLTNKTPMKPLAFKGSTQKKGDFPLVPVCLAHALEHF